MGMFDKPKYLTGKAGEGYVQPGETFVLHNARVDGTVKINGAERPQVKLKVSRVPDEETEIVYTSGAGIVGQVRRMDADDIAQFPLEVRLDSVPSQQGNPTHVLTPANLPPATRSGADGTTSADDF